MKQENRDILETDRVEEWARRFGRGDQFQHSDAEHRAILLDIMAEGPGDGTARHLSLHDIGQFCQKQAGSGRAD